MSSRIINRFANAFFMKTYKVELLILISLIQEIDWLNLKAYSETYQIPVHDGTMVTARWYVDDCDGAMMKTQWYEHETTIERWWKKDCTMVKQRRLDDENVMLLW
jgi:hypothetical protein